MARSLAAAGVSQIGAGTTILTAANSYTGGTTIAAGTLQLGNGGTSGSITGDVADNGALAFDRSDVVSFGGAISGSGERQPDRRRHHHPHRHQQLYRRHPTIAAGTLAAGGDNVFAPVRRTTSNKARHWR